MVDPDLLGWLCEAGVDDRFVRDLCEVRLIVEPAAAELAAARATEQEIAELLKWYDLIETNADNREARLDADRYFHATIFVAIAGTYTAIAGLSLPGSTVAFVLTVVWIGALVGAGLQLTRGVAARWLSAGPYLALGWVALAVVPQLVEKLGSGGFALLVCGALLYSAGAVVYARKRPDPRPLIFGYHEVFHLLVIAAAAAHYAAVAGFVLPRL